MRLTDEQIGAELYTLRATPSETFAAELDAWVAEGFPSVTDFAPSDKRSRGRVRKVWDLITGRPLVAGLTASAAIVAVIGVSLAVYLHNRNQFVGLDSRSGGDQSGLLSAKPPPRSLPDSANASVQAFARPRNSHEQIEEQTARLGLSTDASKLQDAADSVLDVADRYGGLVDSSNVHAMGSHGHASFALRIPTSHLQDALSDLSDLGQVTLRDQGSTNVTDAYVSANRAFATAQARVAALEAQLRSTSDPAQIASLREQLAAAHGQLASARAALRDLKQKVALTPVSVEITAQGDGSWSIGDAADDAVGVLEAIGGAILIALAVLVPLGALLAIAWFGTREIRRRRREAPLDG
jgi:hypothetical protein